MLEVFGIEERGLILSIMPNSKFPCEQQEGLSKSFLVKEFLLHGVFSVFLNLVQLIVCHRLAYIVAVCWSMVHNWETL